MSAAANLRDRSRRVIRTNGTVEALPGPISLARAGKIIGADTLDTVILQHLGEPYVVMLVNDKQYECEDVPTEVVFHGKKVSGIERRPVRALLPANRLATQLYWANCVPGTTHEICGDVVIVPDSDFGVLA